MSTETSINDEIHGDFPTKKYSRKEVEAFLTEIAEKVVDSHGTFLHSTLALNRLLQIPNAEAVFDEELKEQARNLWLQLKSSGLELDDPPLLFGYPQTAAAATKPAKKAAAKKPKASA